MKCHRCKILIDCVFNNKKVGITAKYCVDCYIIKMQIICFGLAKNIVDTAYNYGIELDNKELWGNVIK